MTPIETACRAWCEAEGIDPDTECPGLGNFIPQGETWPAWRVREGRMRAAIFAHGAATVASGPHPRDAALLRLIATTLEGDPSALTRGELGDMLEMVRDLARARLLLLPDESAHAGT